MAQFFVEQSLRDHADHFAAGTQRRVGNDSHQSNSSATINQAQLATGNLFTDLGGNLCKDRIAA